MNGENSPLICAYILEMKSKSTYMKFENLTEFPLQVEIEANSTQDIYDMNFTRFAQPQQATR